MKAGREMDALVAERVMGWRRANPATGREGTWVDSEGWFQAEAECGTEYASDDGPCQGECDEECLRWRPSTSANDSGKVIERLKKMGLSVTLTNPDPPSICEAALRAVSAHLKDQ